MKILTIVPARAGSKGIKKKNFVNFLGKPLIEHTLNFAKKIDKKRILISSDFKNFKKFEKNLIQLLAIKDQKICLEIIQNLINFIPCY